VGSLPLAGAPILPAPAASAGTIKLKATPPIGGYIRLQTLGATGNSTQFESSQLSRTVPLELSDCYTPYLSIKLQAWANPVSGKTGYNDLINGSGTEIEAGGEVAPGTTIWYTYTVTNTGRPALPSVTVRDVYDQVVCVLTNLPPGGTAGCSGTLSPPS
jgi:hypothetical protein